MIPNKNKKTVIFLSKFMLAVSILLYLALLLAYLFEPDFCAVITFWPIWIWAIPAIILTLSAAGVNKKTRLTVVSIWILLIIFKAEEPSAFLRSCLYFNRDCKSSCPSGNCLRIISLNCAGGNINAAEELLRLSPDVVLLQESPTAKELETFTRKLFAEAGEFVIQGDTAIIARGSVTKTEVNPENRLFMVEARIRFPSGLEIETISVHLSPPSIGTNILSPDCWREHNQDRHRRLNKITAINEHLDSIKQGVPIVVGGDFNIKPWNGETKAFSPRLNDSFKQAGCSWPGTGPAHFPLWRVDQIWTTNHFKPIKVWSRHSKYSDHRMVICDLCKL